MTRTGRPQLSPLLLTGLVVVVLALIPLGYVVVATVTMGPHELGALLWRARVGELLGNTLKLLVGTVLVTTVLGVGTAVLVSRTDLPGRGWWHALLSAPLAVPAFVNSYGWVSLTSDVQSYLGAVLVISLSYYPLVYLPVVGALATLEAAPEEVARSLGRSRTRAFLTAALPRLLPAVLGGGLLVGLHVLAEFGALQLLNYPTFTTAIYGQYRSSFTSNAGTVLASVLVALCIVLLLIELLARGRRRLDRVGRGTGRRPEPVPLGRFRPLALLGLLGLVALTLGVPLYSLTHWLVVGSSTAFPVGDLVGALVSTLGLAAAGAAVTVVMAMPLAWLVVRRRGAASTVLERAAYIANALPGIVVALALITVSIRVVPSLYQTLPVLLLAYAVLFLPRALVSVRSSLEHAPVLLDEVSRSLGQSTWATFRRVTLPLVSPGVGAGAALVFLAISTELTATLLLSPIGTDTLATKFWSASSSVQYGAAAPYAVLLILAALPATVMLSRQARPQEVSR
ncbi:iron ABC transporter permease [Nocardioides marmoriginsengisoli]|uniref:Iron ABC transporter permease n=1 Tax=Nocardioides marmoriginsengisoli TaxID=661483 RepID=A0A3N0CLJ3_9ACTN|nr:iron ABC transporter permease [Nocardioides marmoriginsengisoli]RNL64318.1 iron ABC transporter permease [Nocardioides marmoriginsengisoli]